MRLMIVICYFWFIYFKLSVLQWAGGTNLVVWFVHLLLVHVQLHCYVFSWTAVTLACSHRGKENSETAAQVCFVLRAGISLLRPLCQQGVHLGTSDPAHMVRNCRTMKGKHKTRRESGSFKMLKSVCLCSGVSTAPAPGLNTTDRTWLALPEPGTGFIPVIHLSYGS